MTNRKVKERISLHSRSVTALKYSPNRALIASASADQTCCVLNSRTLEQIQTLNGRHSEGLNDVEWLHHSSYLATASDDRSIILWDVETGKDLMALSGHQNFVFSLAIHPFQNILLSSSEDETIKIWDIRVRASCVLSIEGHSEAITCVQFHPSGEDIVSCSYDGLIRIWDMKNGACRRTILHSNKPPISYVRYSPNGRYLLSSSFDSSLRLIRPLQGFESDSTRFKGGNLSTVAAKNTFRCATGVIPEIKTYTGHLRQSYSAPVHFARINSSLLSWENSLDDDLMDLQDLSRSPQSGFMRDVIIGGSDDGTVCVWDLNTQSILRKFRDEQNEVGQAILALDFNPETNEIICNGGEHDLLVFSLHQPPTPSPQPLMSEDDRLSLMNEEENEEEKNGERSEERLQLSL